MTPPVAPSKLPPDFLSPTGSLTPAAAGAIVLLITNTLGAAFGLPRALTALVLSAIVGALIVARFKTTFGARLGYWIVNSLTIFAVALGANGVKDVSGNPLGEEIIARFSTGDSIVIAPPPVEPDAGMMTAGSGGNGMDGGAGSTSGGRRLNSRNTSADQMPSPLTLVIAAITSSSLCRRSLGMESRPSRKAAARSRP